MDRRLVREKHCISEVIGEYFRSHNDSRLYIKLEDPDSPNWVYKLLGSKANPDTLIFYDSGMNPWCSLLPNPSKEDALIELLFGVRKALKNGYDVRPIIDGEEYMLVKNDDEDNFLRKKDGEKLIISGPCLNPLKPRGDVRCSTVRKSG